MVGESLQVLTAVLLDKVNRAFWLCAPGSRSDGRLHNLALAVGRY